MRRTVAIPLLAVGFFLSTGFALQEKKEVKKEDEAAAMKKKAHDEITTAAKAKKRDGKDETKLYDDLVASGVVSDEALKDVKTVVDKDLDTAKLATFVKGQVTAGVKGKALSDSISKELTSLAEMKKKAGEKKEEPKKEEPKKEGTGKKDQ